MILLESVNVIVRNLILDWLDNNKSKSFDFTAADYDGASFRIVGTADSITVSLKSPAAASLMKEGGHTYLSNMYKNYYISPVSGFDVSLQLTNNNSADKQQVATQFASLKSYLYASILLTRMEAANKGQTIPGLVDIPLRSYNERMWVKQDGTDRITVIFSIEFQAHNDSVLGQVFCQEMASCKELGVPSVSYSAKVPSELKEVRTLPNGERVSYLTFVIYDRHWKGNKMETAAFTLTTFRNYLHYHLKCCKSYLHTRMRTRVENLLKVLNRAKQETTVSKKNSGRKNFST